MAKGSDEKIVWLEVSVDNTKGVEILDSKDCLSKIEPKSKDDINQIYNLIKSSFAKRSAHYNL